MSSKIYDLLILGAGPAGIATAYEASLLGIEKILILEKTSNNANTIRNFYEDGKPIDRDWAGIEVDLLGNLEFKFVKEESIALFDKTLKDSKAIEVVYNSEVYHIEKEDAIFRIESKSGTYFSKKVVIAIGRMTKPKKPDYRLPRKLGKKINFDLSKTSSNEKILVVGGGDSATEYACSLSKNNNVVLAYRGKEFHRPNPLNIQRLKKCCDNSDLLARTECDIEEIIDDDGKVKVICSDGHTDTFDRMIFALGGTTPIDFLTNCGIEIDDKSQPIYDENFETNISGLFVGGDIIFQNGGSISSGYNQGYHIAQNLG